MRQARLHIDSGSGETGRLNQELFSFVLGFLFTFRTRKRKWRGRGGGGEVKCGTGIDVILSRNIWRSSALKKGQHYFRWLGSQFIKIYEVQISKENWRGEESGFYPTVPQSQMCFPQAKAASPQLCSLPGRRQPQESRLSSPSAERCGTPAPVPGMFFSWGTISTCEGDSYCF